MINTLRCFIRDERGEIDEIPAWTIYALISLAMIGMIFLFARFASADNTVQAASFAAARDASLSRAADAVPHAVAAAHAALGDNVDCTDVDVRIGGDGLHTALGQSGTVSATVSCRISISDFFLLGAPVPGSFTVTHTAHSPVDPYRER